MEGKKLIIGLEVGSRTQYLARVQGMPKSVEERIVRIIRDFMWAGSRPMVDMDTLCSKRENGGLNLLDIATRNEAIDLVWLGEYLNMEDDSDHSASERQ